MVGTVILLLASVLFLPTTVTAEDSIHLTIKDYPISLESLAKWVHRTGTGGKSKFPQALHLTPGDYFEKFIVESKLVGSTITLTPTKSFHKYDIILLHFDEMSSYVYVTGAQGTIRKSYFVHIGQGTKRLDASDDTVKAKFMREVSLWLNLHRKHNQDAP